MRKEIKSRYLSLCEDLIFEGKSLIKNSNSMHIQRFYSWIAKINTLNYILGAESPWFDLLKRETKRPNQIFIKELLGIIEGIHHSIDFDYLEDFTDIVLAKANADLIEQAEELLSKQYYLAAGVICRAVLEEHLKNLCEKRGLSIIKSRPTLNDFNQALYKSGSYSKTKMKQIDTLITVGNNAAHNLPELSFEDVKHFLRELPGVLESIK